MSESFKEMAGADIMDVFFNSEEFGEVHQVDGKPMTIIIDGYELVERGQKKRGLTEFIKSRSFCMFPGKRWGACLPLAESCSWITANIW